MGSQEPSRVVSLNALFKGFTYSLIFFQYSDLLVSIKLLITPMSTNESVLKNKKINKTKKAEWA